MFKPSKILIASFLVMVAFYLVPLTAFSIEEAAGSKSDGYILIANVNFKFPNEKDCDISVVVAGDKSHVRVLRLDNRKGAYSVNYFSKSPALFGRYGVEYNIENEFQMKATDIDTVLARFSLKEDKHDLKLIVRTRNPASVKEKIFPLGRDFFLDRPIQCLK